MYDLPTDHHWGSPAIQRIGPEKQQRRNSLHKVVIIVFGKYHGAHDARSEKEFRGAALLDFDEDYEDRLGELSLQCEMCGPDLELYQRRR